MLRDYLSRLEWPPEADSVAGTGVTYFELAIDYEVTSGLDLPYSNKDREAGVQTLSERARVLRAMMRELSRQAQAPLYAGVDRDHIYCLAPLGISNSAGISRRPVLLGTAETEQVVKVFEGMQHMGWADSAVPDYCPARELRAAPALRLAVQQELQAIPKRKRKPKPKEQSVAQGQMIASAPPKKLMLQGVTTLGGSAKPTTRGRGSSRGVRGRAKGSGLSSTMTTPVGCKRVRTTVQTPPLVDLGPPAKRGRHGRASTDSGRVLGSPRSHSLPKG